MEPTPNVEQDARELLGALDSVLTMPIVRLSPHAAKLRALRAWVDATDRRVAALELHLRGLGALSIKGRV